MQPILTLDIGNTRIKYAVFNEKGVITASGIWNDQSVLEYGQLQKMISSVRIEFPSEIQKTMQPGDTEFSGANCRDITVTIQNPETLGKDRLAAAYGAFKLAGKKDVLVIDAGTCITYDYVSADGIYSGGAISPGLLLRFKAMNSFTAKLPDMGSQNWEDIWNEMSLKDIGNQTSLALISGGVQGLIDEINARIQRWLSINNGGAVYLTGGDAPFLAKHLKNQIFVEPMLVHWGLYYAAILA